VKRDTSELVESVIRDIYPTDLDRAVSFAAVSQLTKGLTRRTE
jgi:hypothetical protein